MLFDKLTIRFQLKLKDRISAGRILSQAIMDVVRKQDERKRSLVLGIPRGGVLIADIIARELGCEFGIIMPRKLQAPHNKEIAIGAIMDDGTTYVNEIMVKELQISSEYIGNEKIYQLEEIRRRTLIYCSEDRLNFDCNRIKFDGKTIILVDDWSRYRIYSHNRQSDG